MKTERIIIAVLLILLIWFGAAIVRLENYHYASQTGFCRELNVDEKLSERENCLNSVQTRTSFVLHLFYGLRIF